MSMVLGQSPEILRPPFPAWKQHYVAFVEQALSYGLKQVKDKKTPNEIEQSSERQITYWLYLELLALIQDGVITGFTRDVFEIPHVDAPTENADGTSIQNMPDLRFHLTNSQSQGRRIESLNQYAWFCECKIIEEGHTSRTYEKGYCINGIQRFIDGRYAWAMPHAQMIAYVRWPSDAIGFGPKHTELKECAQDLEGDICITHHARKTTKGELLSDIHLRHLWFKFQ